MASLLKFVSINGPTVIFGVQPYTILSYAPKAPIADPITYESAIYSGTEQPITVLRGPAETAKVHLNLDASVPNRHVIVQGVIDDLNSIFRAAEGNQALGPAFVRNTYVVWHPHGLTQKRSPLFTGKAEIDEGSTGWRWMDTKVELTITFRRDYFWEAV